MNKTSNKTSKKLFITLAVVVALVSMVALALVTSSKFSSTVTSGNNSITTGDVVLTSNDAGGSYFSIANGKPGSTQSTCIKVDYSGSLDADVKAYATGNAGDLSPYIDVVVNKGTGSTTFPSCTGFVSTGNLYTGTLANLVSTNGTFANGLAAYPAATPTKWTSGGTVTYQITTTVQDNNAAQAKTTGTGNVVFEAQDQ